MNRQQFLLSVLALLGLGKKALPDDGWRTREEIADIYGTPPPPVYRCINTQCGWIGTTPPLSTMGSVGICSDHDALPTTLPEPSVYCPVCWGELT